MASRPEIKVKKSEPDDSAQEAPNQKAKKEVPLNEEKFNARRAELDSEAEEEKTFEEQAGSNGENEVFKRNFYNNEVLGITLDYLRLLGKDKVAKANNPVAPN